MKLIECPRDAMQSFSTYVPTEVKAKYINVLLKVGFDTIDFGSFVSPKAIPQLKDTAEVIKLLDMTATTTKLLAIIANIRGAEAAVMFDEISYLGFPHAVSPKFLELNINSNPEKAQLAINQISNLCVKTNKQLVVYLSLAFGNPYGEEWTLESIHKEVEILKNSGVKIIMLADTLGDGNKDTISAVFSDILPAFPDIEFGFHLHARNSEAQSRTNSWFAKVNAAYKNGCRRFDSVMLGFGGCPMSGKEILGNLSTENLICYLKSKQIEVPLDSVNYEIALKEAIIVFNN